MYHLLMEENKMKTKKELLKKYEETEYYEVIKENYGSKVNYQTYEGIIINFDKDAMKDIVGAKKLTYEDFIDIQIQTGKDYRGALMLCYYYCPIEFKGEVETFRKNTVCFKRIYVDGMYFDGKMFKGKEEHVWMSTNGFDKLNKGDFVSFFAEPYLYIKTSNGKKLDFGLRNPQQVKKIEKYELPTDKELMIQEVDDIICENCYLYEHCSRTYCMQAKNT